MSKIQDSSSWQWWYSGYGSDALQKVPGLSPDISHFIYFSFFTSFYKSQKASSVVKLVLPTFTTLLLYRDLQTLIVGLKLWAQKEMIVGFTGCSDTILN